MPVYKHRGNPLMMEINTLPFLSRLGKKYHKTLTLNGVPDSEWQYYADSGFDLIWLMGVWQRSPAARKLAISNNDLKHAYDLILPGWKEQDIAGSPYAIYGYSPDSRLGKKTDLAALKNRLNNMGLGLVLDFVPNHLAMDHPWTLKYPERFVRGTKKALAAHPEWFYATANDNMLAHGRDPNFAPWSDTVQVNFFSAEMREAYIKELLRIADMADGVRCDMAMLGLNRIFQQTWGEVFKPRKLPTTEFWFDAITAVKAKHPSFIFIAEVYWGLDGELRKLGFDFTYDKVFYDRLKYNTPDRIQEYVFDRVSDLKHMVHFTENHDELRAGEVFGVERSLMAATAIATVPGMRFFFEGQAEGKMIRAPVQLATAPEEDSIDEIKLFYSRLLASCSAPVFRQGDFIPLKTDSAWEGNNSHLRLLAWCWKYGDEFRLIAINYSGNTAQARIKLPISLEDGSTVICYDELAEMTYNSTVREVLSSGLFISLKPWQAHILDIRLE
jgi:glycosidase